MFTRARTLLVALALTLCLLPSAAQAGVLHTSRSEARTVASHVQELEGIFRIFWKELTRFRGKAGAGIDPTGGETGGSGSNSGGATTDSGASIDPSGSTTDSGASIDPNGNTTNSGASIDPNGTGGG
jgi:hypothetical protein